MNWIGRNLPGRSLGYVVDLADRPQLAFSGCHSYHIEATVENHTGGTITLLEVDYPSASFGSDTLATGRSFSSPHPDARQRSHHRSVHRPHGRAVQMQGPDIYEEQEGSIEIVLLPNGKAEFHPALAAAIEILPSTQRL